VLQEIAVYKKGGVVGSKKAKADKESEEDDEVDDEEDDEVDDDDE
jgi:hypothetical protein